MFNKDLILLVHSFYLYFLPHLTKIDKNPQTQKYIAFVLLLTYKYQYLKRQLTFN